MKSELSNQVSQELVDGLSTAEGRKKFIETMPNDLYFGKTSDGLEVRIGKGDDGLKVMTEQKTKPKWWAVKWYDADGYLEGDGVEHREQEGKQQ